MAATYNFTLDCGATFYRKLTWKDKNGTAINLTGYTAKMQIRRIPFEKVLVELSTEDSTITLSSTGEIELNISATDTATIRDTKAVYDLFLTSPSPTNFVTKLIEGTVTIVQGVTL